MLQLDFFYDKETLLEIEIRKVKESSDKVRKGIFARHNELAKMYVDLDQRLRVVESGICRSNVNANPIFFGLAL